MLDEQSVNDIIEKILRDRKGAERERSIDDLADLAEQHSEFREPVNEILAEVKSYSLEKLASLAPKANEIRIKNWGTNEELSLGELRTQVRRTLIDVKETLSEKELVERIGNGTWMTPEEVEKARGFPKADVLREYKADPETYNTKKEGRLHIGYVTTANSPRVGFDYPKPGDEIAKPTPVDAKVELVLINDKKYSLNHDKKYSRLDVVGYLKMVEPDAFSNSTTVDRAMRYMKSDKDKVDGSELIKLLNEFEGSGIILLSKKRKKALRSTFSKPQSRITESRMESVLRNPSVDKFIHRLPYVFDNPYILSRYEQDFYSAIRSIL